MDETVYLLPESVRKPLIEYLSQKPWREVAQGMEALLGLKQTEQKINTNEVVIKDHQL